MATVWIAIGVIAAAFITRGVKISEFRQAWIDGLIVLLSDINDSKPCKVNNTFYETTKK